MTAFELCGEDMDAMLKIKGGRIVWENIRLAHTMCVVQRVVDRSEGGKPFLLGLNYKEMRIHPDTEIEVIYSEVLGIDKRSESLTN